MVCAVSVKLGLEVSSPGSQQISMGNQIVVPAQANQLLVQADVHQVAATLAKTRKRVRKPALPPSVKRLTPLRKVKVEQKKAKVTDVLNRSENQEEFASCPSGSDEDVNADITEVVLGNSFQYFKHLVYLIFCGAFFYYK